MIEWVWVTDQLPPVETYVLVYIGAEHTPPVAVGKYRPGLPFENKWWAIGYGSVEPVYWAFIEHPPAVCVKEPKLCDCGLPGVE